MAVGVSEMIAKKRQGMSALSQLVEFFQAFERFNSAIFFYNLICIPEKQFAVPSQAGKENLFQ